MAGDYLYPQRGEKSTDGQRKRGARNGTFLRNGSVRHVPHGEWERRKAGAGVDNVRDVAVGGIFYRVGARAEQAAGAGDFGSYEGFSAGVRNGECDDGGWNEVSGSCVERRCVYR